MAMNLKKFLETYFKLVRLNEMKSDDVERWVQFEGLVKKGDLTKNMADWAKLLKRDAAGNIELDVDGFFKIMDLNPDELSEEEWKDLFLNTQNAMSALGAQRKYYANTGEDDVVSFIDDNKDRFGKAWGETKEATAETKNGIDDLCYILKTYFRQESGARVGW